jgi:hypothetical protein
MKMILVLLVLAVTQNAQRADCTALAATQGAMVTLDAVMAPDPTPAPKPAPDGAPARGPIDTYRDAKVLIDKGNALADRSKAILDQAQQDGKITLDIRLPQVAADLSKSVCGAGGCCQNGRCPFRNTPSKAAPPARIPQPPIPSGGSCPGGVCPNSPATQPQDSPQATAGTALCSGRSVFVRRAWRWRR